MVDRYQLVGSNIFAGISIAFIRVYFFSNVKEREKEKRDGATKKERRERERIQNIIMRKNYSINLENRPKNAKCINE